jgi:hypothetical protein
MRMLFGNPHKLAYGRYMDDGWVHTVTTVAKLLDQAREYSKTVILRIGLGALHLA